ncbi:hypothetical protein K469DRAFT_745535 [Zopfia rhizophila CBS 207.26]|uniref:Uncharacterized protein n=1 Tax=Zopfia rhizophila CBS 207.26 TaxID=1314779 RepID=A0A6A6EPW3_9PEZI|nr:hypothetical protein K469DRAFT_745535 [Zopfia rhizophila CBS 207.26]
MHPRRPKPGRDIPPPNYDGRLTPFGQPFYRMMTPWGGGALGHPRYPCGPSPGYDRSFFEDPYASGNENGRRNRNRIRGEYRQAKLAKHAMQHLRFGPPSLGARLFHPRAPFAGPPHLHCPSRVLRSSRYPPGGFLGRPLAPRSPYGARAMFRAGPFSRPGFHRPFPVRHSGLRPGHGLHHFRLPLGPRRSSIFAPPLSDLDDDDEDWDDFIDDDSCHERSWSYPDDEYDFGYEPEYDWDEEDDWDDHDPLFY